MADKSSAMYVSTGEAAKRLGMCGHTLRKLAKAQRIDAILTSTGKFRYNVESVLDEGRRALAARAEAQARAKAAKPDSSNEKARQTPTVDRA